MIKSLAAMSCAVVCFFGGLPLRAMEIPLTKAQASGAVALGRQSEPSEIFGSQEWNATANEQSWPGYTPTTLIETPFEVLAFAAALAKSKYQNIKPDVLTSEMNTRTLRFSTRLFNPVLNAYFDAVGVVKQGGKIIHSTGREIDSPDVVDTPEVGYRYSVDFDFDTRKLNLTQPFVFVVASVPAIINDQLKESGEITFNIDPTQVR